MFQLSEFVRSGSYWCYKHRSPFYSGFIQMHAAAHTSTFFLASSSCLCQFCNAVHWAGTLLRDMGSLWLRMAPCHCCPACSLPARWLVPFPAICSCLASLLATASLCPSCSVKNPSRGRQTHMCIKMQAYWYTHFSLPSDLRPLTLSRGSKHTQGIVHRPT